MRDARFSLPRAAAKSRIMILVVDNYDSFTWNIVHYLRELGAAVEVARNDELSVADALTSEAGPELRDDIVPTSGARNQRVVGSGRTLTVVRAQTGGTVHLLTHRIWLPTP